MENKMNTKQIGDISQIKVMTRLLQKEYSVSVPFGDNQRYDLIFDDGSLKRVQCKTGRVKDNAVVFPTASTYAHRGGTRKTYTDDVDYFGVYCSDNDSVYMIPVEELKDCKASASLRLEPSKNNQIKNVRFAEQFLF